MGVEDYAFVKYLSYASLAAFLFGSTFLYVIYGIKPNFLVDNGGHKLYRQAVFHEKSNPDIHYVHLTGRYTSDPLALLRPIPRDTSKYFSPEDLKRIAARNNRDNPNFGI